MRLYLSYAIPAAAACALVLWLSWSLAGVWGPVFLTVGWFAHLIADRGDAEFRRQRDGNVPSKTE